MLQPATQLEAVNVLLMTIGQSPVNTLSGQVSVDVVRAVNILDHITREVQSLGCTFNTEDDYPLTPDIEGHIGIPNSMISVTLPITDYPRDNYDCVIRGTRLYNKADHSDVFDTAVTLYATVILLLDFEELPQYARWYIICRAARKFQDDSTLSESGHKFTQQDELAAYQTFKRAETEQDQRSMLTQSYINGELHPRTPYR